MDVYWLESILMGAVFLGKNGFNLEFCCFLQSADHAAAEHRTN